ncbi:hypothetical protein AB835_05730 [Candidatus Endobugula sertula]|uniref:High-affinity zinc uptake system protein ZnuA n=1 Tax=Candidatus Endobugula sertula TaxID=62101 RepID=A0A1D2QR07_9GAMM|nr:hypothetical protein AB835_05730 [Candidatus Endobugula sertula]
MNVRRFLLWLLLFMALFPAFAEQTGVSTPIPVAATTPTIITSIRPLGLLAKAVVGQYAKVDILMETSFSAHHYSLTVSDRQNILSADIVLWVGDALETVLKKPLHQRQKTTIQAMKLSGITWPDRQEHHHGPDEYHSDHDPHIWLNPLNNIVVIDALLKQLSLDFPQYADMYQHNANTLKQGLVNLDKRLQHTMLPLQERSFIVAHPAYSHFVERYNLQQLAYITLTPERMVGARHLYRLRQQSRVRCVFQDYGIQSPSVKKLAKDLSVPLLRLDPLGFKSATLIQLIEQLGIDFHHCLAETR